MVDQRARYRPALGQGDYFMARSKLIYVTGTPGSGKSAVCDELKRRGYTAYDTDNDAIAFFFDNATGKAIERQVPASERTQQWRARHTWKAQREVVARLAIAAEHGFVFLCGVTANDADELWDLFDMVFALVIDDGQVLKQRIADRSEDGYGKNPHELAELLRWQRTAAADYEKIGATLIDASQPLQTVVGTILAQIPLPERAGEQHRGRGHLDDRAEHVSRHPAEPSPRHLLEQGAGEQPG